MRPSSASISRPQKACGIKGVAGDISLHNGDGVGNVVSVEFILPGTVTVGDLQTVSPYKPMHRGILPRSVVADPEELCETLYYDVTLRLRPIPRAYDRVWWHVPNPLRSLREGASRHPPKPVCTRLAYARLVLCWSKRGHTLDLVHLHPLTVDEFLSALIEVHRRCLVERLGLHPATGREDPYQEHHTHEDPESSDQFTHTTTSAFY